LDLLHKINDKRQELQLLPDDDAGVFGGNRDEVQAAMQEVASNKVIESYEELVKSLTVGQQTVLQKIHTAIENSGKFLHFCSGMGGTGKSYLAKCMRAWVEQVRGKDIAVAAPMGIAAKNINGITLHRLLQLPVEHGSGKKSRHAKYQPLAFIYFGISLKILNYLLLMK